MTKTENLEKQLGYSFKNKSLLQNALTHSSYINEFPNSGCQCNERLEFLGDAVLEIAVSDYIYHRFPQLEEGKMSQYRSVVVCENGLYAFAKEINLGKYLNMAHGEDVSGGRNKPSILSDAVEAIIAAIYLDSDFSTARDFVISHFEKYILSAVENHKNNLDYKSRLQEYVMATAHSSPNLIKYVLLSETGPDHNKSFKMKVEYGKFSASGIGSSKKKAEQQAAKNLLETLENKK